MDTLMMGGFSIAVCLLAWLFTDVSTPLYTISQLAFLAAFICNHPHFLSSYVLLYGDFKNDIMKKPRYFWAAVVVPAVLGGSLIAALALGNAGIFNYLITAMFFLVGWHYVKQVFGCVIVTSARQKAYYSPVERKLLLANLFATWFMSWLQSQVRVSSGSGVGAFSFYGIAHDRLNLPPWTLQFTYYFVGVTLLAVIWLHWRRFKMSGVKPSLPGAAAYFALYAWYLPATVTPAFAYFIPFFHSLQYLAFVWTLKKNQVAHDIRDLPADEQSGEWLNRFVGFFILSTALGALAFEFVPKALDKWQLISPALGPTPLLAAFLLFINIHHYFIDNVIWRSDNETVKKFLMSERVKPAETGPSIKVA